MIPVVVTVAAGASGVANNIVTSTTPTSGTALTLNGALVTGGVAIMDVPRRVLLTFGNEASGRTLVITGTNPDGNPIQETLIVPSGGAGTVMSVGDYATVTKALPLGGGWTAAATIGTNNVLSSEWKIVDRYMGPVNIAFAGVPGGGANWSLEYTYTKDMDGFPTVNGGANPVYPPVPVVFTSAILVNQTGILDSTVNDPIYAWRLRNNNNTGSVTMTAIQSGLPFNWHA